MHRRARIFLRRRTDLIPARIFTPLWQTMQVFLLSDLQQEFLAHRVGLEPMRQQSRGPWFLICGFFVYACVLPADSTIRAPLMTPNGMKSRASQVGRTRLDRVRPGDSVSFKDPIGGFDERAK